MALNETGGEESTIDTTPVSETEVIEEVEEQPTEAEPTGEEEEGRESTETSGKKGFTQRVRELNSRAKEAERRAAEAEEQIKSMSDKIAELTGSSEPSGYTPQMPQFEPGAEVTPEQLQQHVAQAADNIVSLRMKQQEAISRIKSETSEAVREHPELDPKSDVFDKDLSESVYEAVEAKVRSNPYSANVKQMVDKLMKPYKRAVSKEVGKVSENLAKQVSQTAARPTSVKKSEKSLEEKTIQELERELGIVTA